MPKKREFKATLKLNKENGSSMTFECASYGMLKELIRDNESFDKEFAAAEAALMAAAPAPPKKKKKAAAGAKAKSKKKEKTGKAASATVPVRVKKTK